MFDKLKTQTVNLSKYFNWPSQVPKDEWWQNLVTQVNNYPHGKQNPWGIPFEMAQESGSRVIMVDKDMPEVTIRLGDTATFLCFLHTWNQIPATICKEDPTEGLVVAEYELNYNDGTQYIQPIRGRFEVAMVESPGPVWLAMTFNMWQAIDPVIPLQVDMKWENEKPPFRPPNSPPLISNSFGMNWGRTQMGFYYANGVPLVYVLSNPYPKKKIQSLIIRGVQQSPLLVAGLTLYNGKSHPLVHLPRRFYRIKTPDKSSIIEKAKIDLGGIVRVEHTSGPRDKTWLKSQYIGTQERDIERDSEDIMEIFGSNDATLSVTLKEKNKSINFSLGEAFCKGKSSTGKYELEVLGKRRQWMQIKVLDSSTGKTTPVRIHFSGARGEYLAPYGHHSQINANWFEDYGADVLVGGRSYAYVSGEFTTDMPVGDVYVEIYKGFEYESIRRKVTIKPGQKNLELRINRWKDLRSQGWVTADTHVHFLSPQTAWLEGQAEGINVVNLLASQWGRLFTNVGDYTGRVGVVENDTIVYVGTENRNHMLGHMSMLGTKGLPVYPMCCGGPGESWLGDPDFRTMAEWALENKRRGGLVIRPHFPSCGFTEDPVPILKGLVDALEIGSLHGEEFPTQEWYRYLNCGYRVAVVGGTDKMGAYKALGSLRTYAKLDPNYPFTYENWANAVRAGRTISTLGPLMDLTVDGRGIGDTIEMSAIGGTVEIYALAESFWPLGKLEIVCNGEVVGSQQFNKGSKKMYLKKTIRISGSSWIAARCSGYAGHPASYMAAHTSPVYIKCGETRLFNGPAAEHMLALVEGGIEYLRTLATVFDESSRKRMIKLFNEARKELKGRLIVEAHHTDHYGIGQYHTHGHNKNVDHYHQSGR